MLRAALKVILAVTLAATLAGLASAEMIYHRGNTAEPETLDPSKASTTYEAHILRDLFEGLVMPDATANIMPGAALSWQISDDETVYTFKLREDAFGQTATPSQLMTSFSRSGDCRTQ